MNLDKLKSAAKPQPLGESDPLLAGNLAGVAATTGSPEEIAAAQAAAAAAAAEGTFPTYRLPTTNCTMVLPSGRSFHSPEAVYTPEDDEVNDFLQDALRVGNVHLERGQKFTEFQAEPTTGLIV